MATNRILPFAPTDTGSNLLTDTEYGADGQRTIGNQPGTARSKLVNKALRNSTAITAALAQLMADNQATDIADSLTTAQLVTALKNALSAAGIFTTPPQFDSTTRVATTAFVQGAGLRFASMTGIAVTTTLTAASHAGRGFTLNSGSPFTITLPVVNTLPSGGSIYLKNTGAAPVTIVRQASDVIYGSSAAPNLTSVVLNPGDDALFSGDAATTWILGLGSAALRYSQVLGGLAGVPGYQRFPNGLIMQWGSGTNGPSSGGSSLTVTFPIAFPAAVLALYVTLNTQSGAGGVANPAVLTIFQSGSGLTQAVIQQVASGSASPTNYSYLAIGI